MSGFTTTGATILPDIEVLPRGILLWRSLTQWLGGMGIVVLSVAVLPMLGIGGMQLFHGKELKQQWRGVKQRSEFKTAIEQLLAPV